MVCYGLDRMVFEIKQSNYSALVEASARFRDGRGGLLPEWCADEPEKCRLRVDDVCERNHRDVPPSVVSQMFVSTP